MVTVITLHTKLDISVSLGKFEKKGKKDNDIKVSLSYHSVNLPLFIGDRGFWNIIG